MDGVEFLPGAGGSQIALYHVGAGDLSRPPVLMTHGTFSNRTACWPLAEYLVSGGFDCWLYEWLGHGQSSDPPRAMDADFQALHDVPRVVAAVREKTGADSLFWVAHSGGGFLPLMYLARHPERIGDFAGVVGLGSQSISAGDTLYGKLRILILAAACHLFGRAPGHWFGIGPEPESKGFMLQWARWNWSRRWRGLDQFDYFEGLASTSLPMLAIAGSADIIAPARGCQALVSAVDNPGSRFLVAGRANGFQEDYDHARLVLSRNAAKEIWPEVHRWLVELS